MKVGTDGVLLGAWAAVRPQDRRMLDIGTGTGLIALMLAQRAPEAHVTGVDIDDVGQARENAAASPWSGRVAFAQCPVQEFETPEPFDLIVSNPPFFVDSLTCPDRGRTAARHAVHLPFGDLRDAVLRLLAPGGRFAVILPTAEAERFLAVCAGRLALVRRTDVRTTPRRPAKRALMEFVRRTRREGRIACSYACEGFLGGYEMEARDHFYHCDAGVSVASIRVDGAISGCTSVRADYAQGNIYRDDFWQVWAERFEPFRRREWMRRGACADCAAWRYCEGGPMHLRDADGGMMHCSYRRLCR